MGYNFDTREYYVGSNQIKSGITRWFEGQRDFAEYMMGIKKTGINQNDFFNVEINYIDQTK